MNPEALLQSNIIKTLYDNGYTAFPAEFRGQRGCPDLTVFREGHGDIVWLEVKTQTGVCDRHQTAMQDVLKKCGQFVYVVRDAEEALNRVDRVFFPASYGEPE